MARSKLPAGPMTYDLWTDEAKGEDVMSHNDPNALDQIRANVSKLLAGLDPKSPISSTAVFKMKKSEEEKFKEIANELAEAARRSPGCVVFEYQKHHPYEGESGKGRGAVEYLIYEAWARVADFQAQANSTHLKEFLEGVFDVLGLPPPDQNFYTGWHRRDAGAGGRTLQTGQKRCWDSKGGGIDCAGAGQDATFEAGVASPSPRFIDNKNGSVTDNLTGLTWLKNANQFGEVTRDDALKKAHSIASGSYGLTDGSKAGDWRLPNVNELQSLLDLNNRSGPAIPAGHPFTNLSPANYWSSTSVAAFPSLGWYTALAVGPPVFDLKLNVMRMWPVRGESELVAQTGQKKCYGGQFGGDAVDCAGTGQDGEMQTGAAWPHPRFTDHGDGTVTDNLTGLIWSKNANPFGTRTWDQALEDCRNLASGSYGLSDGSKSGDWRLPNINELRSLEDYGEHTPALQKGHPFTNVRQSLCWSSTTVASAPNLARFLFVGIGSCVWDHKSVLMGVWPVKGGR